MGNEGIGPPFFISVVDGSEWPASCHGIFTIGEKPPGTHCIGDGVGLRAGLDTVEKYLLPLPGVEVRPPIP